MLSHFSHVRLSATPGSSVLGISLQEYWSGLPYPPPGDLPDPEVEPTSLRSLALASRFFTTSATRETCISVSQHYDVLFRYLTLLNVNNMSIS